MNRALYARLTGRSSAVPLGGGFLFSPDAHAASLPACIAERGGATGIRIVPRFKVRKGPASDKFVKAKDVPEFIRVTACMEPA